MNPSRSSGALGAGAGGWSGSWITGMLATSDQSVLTADLGCLQAAETGVQPTARREGPAYDHFVAIGRIVERHAHRVIVGAYIKRVLVRERDVEDRAGHAALA